MATEAKDKPDYELPAYTKQLPAMDTMRDILGGSEAVRAKGEAYLPKGMLETATAYKARLNAASLFSATKRTWAGFLGLLFKESPTLGADVPELIRGKEAKDNAKAVEGFAENIDLQGNSLPEFLKETAGWALRDGHAVVVVDMPPAVVRADGLTATRADESAAGLRPYWVAYDKSQVVNWQTENRNGRQVLSLVVLKECATVADGAFGSTTVERYRVYRNHGGVVTSQVFTKVEVGEAAFTSEPEITITNQTKIPIAAMYAHKIGLFQSEPPLLGMGEENLRHYRLRSTLEKLITHSFPVTITKGSLKNLGVPDGANQDLAFSPEAVLELPDTADATAFLLEPRGTGIAPLQAEIKECESRMARLGLSLLEPAQQTGKTNTEAATDEMEEQSELDFFRTSIKDCVESLLMFTAHFIGEKSGGSFEMKSAMGRFKLSPQKLQSFSQMVAANQFPLEDFLGLLVEAGEVPETFDVPLALAKLKAEKAAALERQQKIFDAGFTPPGDDE